MQKIEDDIEEAKHIELGQKLFQNVEKEERISKFEQQKNTASKFSNYKPVKKEFKKKIIIEKSDQQLTVQVAENKETPLVKKNSSS